MSRPQIKPSPDGTTIHVVHEGETHDLRDLVKDNPDLHDALREHLDAFVEGTPDDRPLEYETSREEETEEIDEILKYLAEEHRMTLTAPEITKENLPFMAFDAEGMVALHGDEQLREEMGVSSNIEVSMSQEGQVRGVYTPFRHD